MKDQNSGSLVTWITNHAIDGVGPLSSATNLAGEYLLDRSYADARERVDSLINWETAKNFTGGFITGLGGIITLPVAVPASLGASWIIQARMAAAIALIGGYDLKSDRVRTFVAMCLVGDAVKEIVKNTGIQIGKGLSKAAIARIQGSVLAEINKRVGFRLITKAGEKGAINLTKALPIIGGVIGGTVDATSCRAVGRRAKALFLPGS